MQMEPNPFWSRIYKKILFYWRFEELQAPNPETMNPNLDFWFFLKKLQIGFFERNKQSYLDLFWVYFDCQTKKECFEDTETNSKFCEMNLGFVDSGSGVSSDKQVEKLSCEIQL